MADGLWDRQREHGITSFFMHDVRDFGIREVVERTLARIGDGPVFLTVDVDVLDPSVAPGTGTPEPGGMMPIDLNWACRTVAAELELVGADVVEVIPVAYGSADLAALWCERAEKTSSSCREISQREAISSADTPCGTCPGA